ncbi:hypothetical protein PHET_00741 [Paragonimus heterotremus]|uniref:G-protein coupled receptors family 1 profile domain-containing protein n=1 Tax=Paragonimus heterotremus TaxID=100268 RepID=A0A8J4SUP9_9TREM|nr:hypothetical protein PHET_00741 [Paragonimus heterotremus]
MPTSVDYSTVYNRSLSTRKYDPVQPTIEAGGKFIIKPHYNSCTLNPNKFSSGNEILPFIFSTLFTYMLPCVLLLLTNMVIAYQLARLHTRRRLLRNTKDTDKHINTWRTGSDAKPREAASSSVTLNPTVASILQRRKTAVLENRREAYRVIALLILSGLYLCFTCPVSITISIRASLSPESPPCRLLFYAHLTRLLTSIKDINYALNGYIYAFFFQFYRVRLLALFTCGQLNLNKQSRSTPMSAYSPTEQNPLDSPGTWSPAENTARSVHPSKNRADCADD